MGTMIQALAEKRKHIVTELRDQMEKNPGALWAKDPSNQARYDAGMAEIEGVSAEIKRHQDIEEKAHEEFSNVSMFQSAAKIGHDKRTPGAKMYEKVIKNGMASLSAAEWAEIRNVMSTTTATQGGFSVQSDVASELIDSLKFYGGMRSVSTVFRTASGNPMSFPSSDGTAETGEWIAENATATSADPVFGTVALNVFKASSKVVPIPFELLQDSQLDMIALINNRLTTRIGRTQNAGFTVGTGTAQPFGVVTQATSGKVGLVGQTLTVIFDDLVDMVHSVDVSYRTTGCKWQMNDLSLRNIRKIKDTQNRPIFIPGDNGLGGALGNQLLGYDIVINNDIAVMAANAKSILFGDFSKYYIRDSMDVSLFRFDDSAYAKLGQVGFLMWMRTGGNLTDTAAVKHYANSAT